MHGILSIVNTLCPRPFFLHHTKAFASCCLTIGIGTHSLHRMLCCAVPADSSHRLTPQVRTRREHWRDGHKHPAARAAAHCRVRHRRRAVALTCWRHVGCHDEEQGRWRWVGPSSSFLRWLSETETLLRRFLLAVVSRQRWLSSSCRARTASHLRICQLLQDG